MKVIKSGRPVTIQLKKGPLRFECRSCGCVFEAKKGEYRVGSQYNETEYMCNCPECGQVTSKLVVVRRCSS